MTLPINALVRSFRADLEGELARLLRAGKTPIDIGLGPRVDVPLLTDDLLAAHVAWAPRQIVIARVRRTARGYVIARESNFGVFWRTPNETDWVAIRPYSHVEGLLAGDTVGLGSCPADAIAFQLPALVGDAPTTEDGGDWRAAGQLQIAVAHWRYADLTVGSSPRAVVRLTEPAFARAALMLSRDLDRPEAGFQLRVLHPGPGTALAAPGELDFARLDASSQRRIDKPGYRLRLGGHVLPIPAPIAPTPRFSSREKPSIAEILEVFDLGPHDLEDAAVVKARYRELVRRFHPDRHANPGHTSRFLEVQACWAALGN